MNGEIFSLTTAKEREISKQKITILEKMIAELKEVFSYDIKPSQKNNLLEAIVEDTDKELNKINAR